MHDVAFILARTTICTSLAAICGTLWLRTRKRRDPYAQRLAAVLILLQGWMLISLPLPLPISNPQIAIPDTFLHQGLSRAARLVAVDPETPLIPAKFALPSNHVPWLTIVWTGGAVFALTVYLRRYLGMVRHLPLGRTAVDSLWHDEWQSVVQQCRTSTHTQFRVTDTIGPALCYLPFFYAVLVPERLWSFLDRHQRMSILRHELIHLARRDLWKSAGIRLLALPQWFNPLAWVAVGMFDEAAEWACDDAVVASAGEQVTTSYASALLRIAEFQTPSPCGAIAAHGGSVGTRIRRILDPSIQKEIGMMKVWIPTLLVLLLVGQAIRMAPAFATDHTTTPASQDSSSRYDFPAYRVEATDILVISTSAPVANPDLSRQTPVKSTYEISSEGTISLGAHGDLFVNGSTLEEVRNAVAEALSCDAKSVDVNVFAYNSKKYFIVVRGFGSGDRVKRQTCTGNETVLDAIATFGGLGQLAPQHAVKIWIERAEKVNGPFAILPIEWSKITVEGDTKTNYTLFPGDRLIVDGRGVATRNKRQFQISVDFVQSGSDGSEREPVFPSITTVAEEQKEVDLREGKESPAEFGRSVIALESGYRFRCMIVPDGNKVFVDATFEYARDPISPRGSRQVASTRVRTVEELPANGRISILLVDHEKDTQVRHRADVKITEIDPLVGSINDDGPNFNHVGNGIGVPFANPE